MVEVYAILIINKRKTINKVPASKRAAVIEKLFEMGYDKNGDPIEVPEEEVAEEE